ncbi:hypothetical protein M0R45_000308 [Rubus argutus]|uniref:J domain-containing protein n=1 Tax=Rubus argutus TaxID=59490 RepID=A0AAW1VLU7_RUBAR
MDDHYAILGLTRKASKQEIKEAFRKLAVKLHPDKHSHSSKAVRDSATLRFKKASEAYQVLIDDRKRADYNFRTSASSSSHSHSHNPSGYGYGYSSYNRRGGGGPNYASGSAASGASRFDNVLRYLTTRAFLLNVSVAGALLGGVFVVNMGRDALWKMRNSGKSYEEAMEAVEKTKAHKKKL